jgi:hypothetical protein
VSVKLLFRLACVASLFANALSVIAATTPQQKNYTAQELKDYFETVQTLDDTKTLLYPKLVARFGNKPTYSDDEVTAILEPKDKYPITDFPEKNEDRTGPPPPGAMATAKARQYFEVQHKHNPKSKGSMEALESMFGKHNWYLARELRLVDQFGDQKKDYVYSDDRRPTPIVEAAEAAAPKSRWQSPMIRHDWSDVLYAEDMSQPDRETKKVDDLVGATFSFAHDLKADTDTWNTVGSLIWPWVYHSKENLVDLDPETLAIAPSVSVKRISTNGPPTGEIDELFYRLGVYGEWSGPPNIVDYLQVRGAFVYGTDTGFRASLPGYEIDMEPRSFALTQYRLSLGERNILWPRKPVSKEGGDQSLLDYQLRVWLHTEGGDIQDNGKTWNAVEGSFFRLGPVVQLRINFPQLYKGFSITGQYSHLSALEGSDQHESLWKLSAALTLYKDKETGRKVSLTTDYINGGLDFTKQEVETLTFGLSVIY